MARDGFYFSTPFCLHYLKKSEKERKQPILCSGWQMDEEGNSQPSSIFSNHCHHIYAHGLSKATVYMMKRPQ